MDKHGQDEQSISFTCRELTQLITDYWEGALSPADAASFEHHMSQCGPCEDYVEQVRIATLTVGSLRDYDVPESTRTALFEMFRAWKSGRNQAV